jgi:hypothetical protein
LMPSSTAMDCPEDAKRRQRPLQPLAYLVRLQAPSPPARPRGRVLLRPCITAGHRRLPLFAMDARLCISVPAPSAQARQPQVNLSRRRSYSRHAHLRCAPSSRISICSRPTCRLIASRSFDPSINHKASSRPVINSVLSLFSTSWDQILSAATSQPFYFVFVQILAMTATPSSSASSARLHR